MQHRERERQQDTRHKAASHIDVCVCRRAGLPASGFPREGGPVPHKLVISIRACRRAPQSSQHKLRPNISLLTLSALLQNQLAVLFCFYSRAYNSINTTSITYPLIPWKGPWSFWVWEVGIGAELAFMKSLRCRYTSTYTHTHTHIIYNTVQGSGCLPRGSPGRAVRYLRVHISYTALQAEPVADRRGNRTMPCTVVRPLIDSITEDSASQ